MARAKDDADFRAALFTEGMNLLLNGELAAGKSILRDFINATIGFPELASKTGKSAKSLMRMFSAQGNPRMDSLFGVIHVLQAETDVQLSVEEAA